MNDLLQIGDQYRFGNPNGINVVYEVIDIIEPVYSNDYFFIKSKYFNQCFNRWGTVVNNSNTLQRFFDDGEITIVGETLKPTRHILKHKIK